MEIEEIGKIGYGNLTFVFEMSLGVRDFLVEKRIESTFLFPQSQVFYQVVLKKLGISHQEERELNVVFHGMRLDGKGVSEVSSSLSEHFENFPIHLDESIYLVDFYVEAKD